MRVRDHLALSTAGAMLALPWLGRDALAAWAGGVLIDADHYAWFCLRERRLNPLAAARFFDAAHPPQHRATRAMHHPAALLTTLLLGLRLRRLLPVAAGMGLHIALDAQHEVRMDRARAAALARDHHACRVCGSAARDIETHLWHQPRLLPSYATGNLVSVCGPCHGDAHRRRSRTWR